MRTGAVISAAGHHSTGTVFRPMLPIGNTTVIKRIIITLKRAGVEPIVVITGDQGEAVEKHISKMRVICLRNDRYAQTPMFDSICKGLRYVEDLCDRVLIMPTRAPLFLAETIEKMLESEAEGACPVYEGRRGNPVMITKKLLRMVVNYEGDQGLRGALRQPGVDGLVEEIPVEDQGIIMEIETDEDCKSVLLPAKYRQIPMHGRVSVYLESDERFFGPGIAQFLSLIDHTGSMQMACTQMHMSYSKGWKIIKTAQKQLGYPLLVTQAGGAEGGFSEMTPKARDFLNRFLKMEKELQEEGERLFQLYFGDERDRP